MQEKEKAEGQDFLFLIRSEKNPDLVKIKKKMMRTVLFFNHSELF